MSVLSTAAQKQVEDILVTAKAVTADQLTALKEKASKENTPILSLLVNDAHVPDEMLTKAIAQATKVPYVNLSNARIDPEILELLPQDIAERYMAVPLGEMQNRLVVAMLDADNVQAVDFLSNKIGRPLKVYAASEAGIKHIIEQYEGSVADAGVEIG